MLESGVVPEYAAGRLDVSLVSRGANVGVLTVYRRTGAFAAHEEQLIRWYADAAALALDNARIRESLKQLAQTDSLTGLLNHRVFQERLRAELSHAQVNNVSVTLLMLDVDDFKRVNDVHGHDVGDEVLTTLAELLCSVARVDDHVCRVGGEELAVIMPGSGASAAVALADRLNEQLRVREIAPVGAITVSVGIAECPRHARSGRELIARAEGAMMSAKMSGKNQIAVHDDVTSTRPSDELATRRDRNLRSIAHLKMLQSLSAKLNRLNNVELIGETIVEELRTLIEYHSCRVYLAEGDMLMPIAFRGELAYSGETVDTLTVRFGEGVTGTAAVRRSSLLIPDADNCEFAVQIPGTDAVTESMVAVPLLHELRTVGVVVVSKLGLAQFDDDDVRLLEVLAAHAAVAIENARLYEAVQREAESLERTFLSTVEALANALEANDADTSSHARAISDLALQLGLELELDEVALKRLELGALFHDIGKIGIPSEILTKPGPLTPTERRLIETHPELGERILGPIERLAEVRPIVRHCHERWDGAGYPDGLSGEMIPFEARIIHVVDAYHAMTSDRPYRSRLSHDEACRRLRLESGSQFDPAIVASFLALAQTTAVAARG
ncbi:MAG: HD domain-containing phosphohydrolase [Gaiellaceae bacterium]